MEINQNNKPVTVTFSDGTVKQVIYDSIEFLEGGNVSLRGHLSDLPTETVVGDAKRGSYHPTTSTRKTLYAQVHVQERSCALPTRRTYAYCCRHSLYG